MVDLATFIEEQYEEMKFSGLFIEPLKYYEVEKVLEKLNKKPVSPDIKELDKCRYKERLSNVLSQISFEQLYSNFDTDFLFWIWSNIPFSENKDRFLIDMKNNLDLDGTSMRTSLLFTMYEKRGINSESVISTYDLIEYSKLNFKNLSIEDTILKHIKIDCNKIKRDEFLADFNIFPLYRDSDDNTDRLFNNFVDLKTGKTYTIGLDGPVGMALTYHGLPCAVTSYYSPEKNSMMIMQFQGIRPSIKTKMINNSGKEILVDEEICLKELNYIHWDKILLDIDLKIAKDMNYKKIAIISHKNHPFYGPDRFGREHLTEEKGMKRYDMFAEQNEFIQRKNGNWYKTI